MDLKVHCDRLYFLLTQVLLPLISLLDTKTVLFTFQVSEAAKFLLNILRINHLTSDMSWRPGIPLKVEESKWKTSVQPKAKSIAIINKVFPYTPGKKPKRKRSRRSSSVKSSVSEVSFSEELSTASNTITEN